MPKAKNTGVAKKPSVGALSLAQCTAQAHACPALPTLSAVPHLPKAAASLALQGFQKVNAHMSSPQIVTRFAPSPTGYLHIGGGRTALFNWLYARGRGGKFLLRIEDTDRERSTDEAVRVILEGMHWLGLDPDEGPYFQTKRFDRYREVINQLLAEGKAYRCYCTKEELEQLRADQMARKEKPRYDGRWRDRTDSREGVAPVIRFKNPLEGEVVVEDQVHGRVVFQNSELDDLIIARGDGTPTYNFCVVVDDMDMGVTHVIRGDDHLNNTPRQINMFAALGAKIPVFAHVPMILGPDGAKLSKRHGAVSVLQYEEDGFLPDLDAVPPATWDRCQLLYLCSPGNPAGAVMDLAFLRRVIALAERHDFIIAADECYADIYPDDTRPPTSLLSAAQAAGNDASALKDTELPGLKLGVLPRRIRSVYSTPSVS